MLVTLNESNAKTIQTHNAVSIAPSAGSNGSGWIDCTGFKDISITLLNDAATSTTVNVNWSNDGVTFHGDEQPLPTSTLKNRAATTKVKARYARVNVANTDTVAHTISAWAYLTI